MEDERPIAAYVEELTREVLGTRVESMRVCHDLDDAADELSAQPIDLCLLDLNLNGEDGYELLRHAAAGSFATIVISANTDRAVEAFRYGVLDFVPKPFDRARLAEALARMERPHAASTDVVAIRQGREIRLIGLDEIRYFRSAGNYVEAHLRDGTRELLEKTMTLLERMLPPGYERVHRSYLVDLGRMTSFGHVGGGNYEIRLADGAVLPLSREKARELRGRFES